MGWRGWRGRGVVGWGRGVAWGVEGWGWRGGGVVGWGRGVAWGIEGWG